MSRTILLRNLWERSFIMETVFDHRPTHRELETLFASLRMAEWLRDRSTSQEGHWVKIACLMAMRGNGERAKSYCDLIENPKYRFQVKQFLNKRKMNFFET